MKNRVTKRMFRKMVSTTAAAAILGVSLCACGAGPADAAREEAASANAAEAESGQEAAPRIRPERTVNRRRQKPRRKRQRKAQSPPEKQERRGRYGLCTASIVSVIWKRKGTP